MGRDAATYSATSADLDALVRRELLRSATTSFAGEVAFRFRHILIRDAVYRAMAKKLRAELHERFADWLERTAGDRLAEYEEICGYHLEQAYLYRVELGPVDERGDELAKRAGERLGAAGGRSLARGDMAGAVSLLSRASSLLLEDEPKRLQILPQLGSALARVGELGRADAVLSEAIDGALIGPYSNPSVQGEHELVFGPEIAVGHVKRRRHKPVHPS